MQKRLFIKCICAFIVCAACLAPALFVCSDSRAEGPVNTPALNASITPDNVPETPKPTPTPKPTQVVTRVSRFPDNYDTLYSRLVEQEITIFDIQQDVANGLYSYKDLTRFCLSRIKEYKGSNITLRTLDTALAQAAKCDRSPSNGSPLFGIPFIVLDTIDVAGAPTTAGTYLMRERVPESDAFFIHLLTMEGAIPIAKANLDEWSGLVITYSQKTPHGSSIGGVPVSPYGSSADVGGTDFGAAVSVTLNLAPIAVGTDAIGNMYKSAWNNSVVGIRPSRALVSRTGIIPSSRNSDTAVAYAKTVREAAYLLYAMQGSDVNDAHQQAGNYAPMDDPREFLKNAALSSSLDGKRILLFGGSSQFPEELINALIHVGTQLVEDLEYLPFADDPAMEQFSDTRLIYGVRDGVTGFLAAENIENVTSIPQLLLYNEDNGADAIPFGQARLNRLALLPPMQYAPVSTVDEYIRSHRIDQFMADNELDLILSINDTLCAYSNMPLNPSVSLPIGKIRANGTTTLRSVVFTARDNNDELAIRAAYAAETRLGSQRVKP